MSFFSKLRKRNSKVARSVVSDAVSSNFEDLPDDHKFGHKRGDYDRPGKQQSRTSIIPGVSVYVSKAENLRVADRLSGSSDPYVKITLGKEKAKTRVRKNNLNPIWEEALFVEWADQSDSILTAHVFDWDPYGYDSLGGIEIDVKSLIPGEPVELELDLEPMEKVSRRKYRVNKHSSRRKDEAQGKLFLTVKLTKEKSVDTNDGTSRSVQLENTGKKERKSEKKRSSKRRSTKSKGKIDHEMLVTVDIVEARNLFAMDSNGKSDPYCKVILGEKVYKTKSKSKTRNPVWNKSVEFKTTASKAEVASIYFDVYDKDTFGKDDWIGRAEMKLKKVPNNDIVDTWLKLISSDDPSSEMGEVHCVISCTLRDETGMALSQPLNEEFIEKYVGSLRVHVIEATKLKSKDLMGGCDPFVELSLGNARTRTEVIKKTLNPVWNSFIELPVANYYDVLNVKVFDKDKVGASDFVGGIVIPVMDVQNGKKEKFRLKAKNMLSTDAKRGNIHLELTFTPTTQMPELFSLIQKPQRIYKQDKPDGFSIGLTSLHIRRIQYSIGAITSGISFLTEILSWQAGFIWGVLGATVWAFICLKGQFWHLPLYGVAFILRQRSSNYQGHIRDSKGNILYAYPEVASYNEGVDEAEEMEALEEEEQAESGGGGSIFTLHKRLAETGRSIQHTLDVTSSSLERFRNCFNWTLPHVSWILIGFFLVLSLLLFIFPIHLILLVVVEALFIINFFTHYIGVLFGKKEERIEKPAIVSQQSTIMEPGFDLHAFTKRMPSEMDKQKRRRI